jgi:hypothetical protein
MQRIGLAVILVLRLALAPLAAEGQHRPEPAPRHEILTRAGGGAVLKELVQRPPLTHSCRDDLARDRERLEVWPAQTVLEQAELLGLEVAA